MVNVSGLALAISTAILILLWLEDELSIDRFHYNGNRIYRVMTDQQYSDGKRSIGSYTTYPLADALLKDVPEIEKVVRVSRREGILVETEDDKFIEELVFTDADFFNLFSFPVIRGNKEVLFDDPYSVVLSETTAKKYFGIQDALGKTIRIKSWIIDHDFIVTGVIEDAGQYSTIKYDLLLPANILEMHVDWMKSWGTTSLRTYLLIPRNTPKENIDVKIKDLATKYHTWQYEMFLQPFEDGYLYNHFEGSREASGRILYVRLFAIVAVVILLIGCINFVNLATAHSATRAREIGVRKVLGAVKPVLIQQFMAEALLVAALAMLLALLLAQLVLPSFNSFVDKEISIPYLNPYFYLGLFLLFLVTGFASGIYPAFFLSRFNPLKTLKSGFYLKGEGAWLRKGLVIFQFTISTILIVVTLVLFRQLQYINNKNLGFSKENVVYFSLQAGMYRQQQAFENDLTMQRGISSFTFSGQNPMTVYHSSGDPEWEGKDPATRLIFPFIDCGYGFLETLGIQWKKGGIFQGR